MFTIITAIIGCSTFLAVIFQLFSSLRTFHLRHPYRSIFSIMGSLLLLYGIVGFFGSAISATGGLRWLSTDHEFPMGIVTNAIKDQNNNIFCPTNPYGRIQVYDKDFKYIRGWFVNAYGGSFRIRFTPGMNIQVATARQQKLYEFSPNGVLLSESTYAPGDYSDFSSWPSQIVAVPTPIILWPMFHPFGSWGVAALGMIMLGILRLTKVKGIT